MKLDSKSVLRVTGICAVIIGAAVAGATLATPRPAMAQSAADAKSQQPVTLNFENGDINAVLKTLFNDIGANCAIDSDVHGTVTISMSNVGFLAALRSVMRANNPPLTFEYVDGVYHVRLKHQDRATTSAGIPPDQGNGGDNGNGNGNSGDNPDNVGTTSSDNKRWYKIPIDHYDVIMMARFVGGMDKKASEVIPSTTASGSGGAGGMAGGGMAGGMGGGMGGGGMAGGMAGGSGMR